MQYSAGIVSRPYFYKETRKAATLVSDGLELKEIKTKSIEDNIFQFDSENRRKGTALTIISRLRNLDSYIIEQISSSNVETSKLLVLYSIIKNDLLFFEFMNEVFREKILLKDLYIRDKDFNNFFQTKREQDTRVNEWKEYTFSKLKQVYLRILIDSGVLDGEKGQREIKVPIINNDIKEYIYSIGDKVYINAILGITE